MGKNKITMKFNLLLYLFIILHSFYVFFIELLIVKDINYIRKKTFIDIIIGNNHKLKILIFLFMLIIELLIPLIQAYFVREVWNRMITAKIDRLRELNYSEALTISILIFYIFECYLG